MPELRALDVEKGVGHDSTDNMVQEKPIPTSQMLSTDQAMKTTSHPVIEPLEESSQTAIPTPEDEQALHIGGLQLAVLILAMALGQMLLGLDASIITTALPKITGEFHSLNDIGWYGLVYLLATTVSQPVWNKAFMFFDVKYTFALAILIFELGSVVCAVAHSSAVLIVGRAIAGVGQAALLAGGGIVIIYRIPLERRAIFFSIFQSVDGIAALLGPPLGGIFTDSETLTWRFCFWINLPLAAIVVVGLIYLKDPGRAGSKASIWQKVLNLDLPGTVLFTLVWICVFMALENGGSTYAWSDSHIWGWFIGFAVCLVSFIALQWHQGDLAILPFSILRQQTVAFSCIFTGLIISGFNSFIYFLPFYFQAAEGVSARQSGIYLMPMLGSMMLGCLGSSALLVKVGTLNPFPLFGAIAFTLASGCLTMLQVDTPMSVWIGLQILLGIGFGSTTQFALIAIQAAVGFERSAIGNGLFFVSNFGGGTIGIGLAQVIFINVLRTAIKDQLPSLDPHMIISAGPTAISSVVPPDAVEKLRQLYCLAVARTFYFPTATAALGCLCVLGIKWINLKKL